MTGGILSPAPQNNTNNSKIIVTNNSNNNKLPLKPCLKLTDYLGPQQNHIKKSTKKSVKLSKFRQNNLSSKNGMKKRGLSKTSDNVKVVKKMKVNNHGK